MEVVGGLGGLVMPLILLFLVASFFDRSEHVEQEAKKIRGFMEELMSTFIKSPLTYTGGKTKILPQIIPLFPDDIEPEIEAKLTYLYF